MFLDINSGGGLIDSDLFGLVFFILVLFFQIPSFEANDLLISVFFLIKSR